MPHTPVPADELKGRLDRLRAALFAHDADWSMAIFDSKVDLYYLTGTMQDGALIITPDQAVFFVRRSLACAQADSLFPDLRPMGSFRDIAAAFPNVPRAVYVATQTMTLQKITLLQKYLPFTETRAADRILSALRSVKSEYELCCMRKAGAIHAEVIETVAPTLLRAGVSEAALCGEVCTALLARGAMGVSRFNQPAAEDVLGICSFGENSLRTAALDSPSGTVGTCLAMKSAGSHERLLAENEPVLFDIASGWRGYHTDKSMVFFFGSLAAHPEGARIRAAHEQCAALERRTAELLVPGAVPAEIYAEIVSLVDPAFRDGFMNGAKFLGHSIGLTMDEAPVLATGFTSPIVAGQTFAVEPKIALPCIGLIGSENTYEVCASGAARSLTGSPDAFWQIEQ